MRLVRLIAASVLAMQVGCGPNAAIRSVVDPDFNEPINRIYVAVGQKAMSEEKVRSLAHEISVLLEDHHVAAATTVFSQAPEDISAFDMRLSLDTTKINKFEPDAMLVIYEREATWVTSRYGKNLAFMDYDASLYAEGSTDRIWRASITVVASPVGRDSISKSDLAEAALKIVEQMQRDGLFETQHRVPRTT